MPSQKSKLRRARPLLTIALLACAAHGWSQSDTQQTTPRTTPGAQLPIPGSEGEPQDPMQRKIMHDAARKRNVERQEELTADANKLLELAQQLKAEVDKSSKDQLSLNVVKKAEEIEKLAKSVKEKMKGAS